MPQTYSKIDKLKSKKLIDELFTEGKSVSAYPLRIIYKNADFKDAVIAKTGVSVSKKNVKLAVDRNRIKRLMREAYRLNKASYFNNITTQYTFMILYIGKEKLDFHQIESKMNTAFQKFLKNETPSKNIK